MFIDLEKLSLRYSILEGKRLRAVRRRNARAGRFRLAGASRQGGNTCTLSSPQRFHPLLLPRDCPGKKLHGSRPAISSCLLCRSCALRGQRCRAVSMAALIAMAAPSTDGRRGIAGRIRGGAGHGGAHERGWASCRDLGHCVVRHLSERHHGGDGHGRGIAEPAADPRVLQPLKKSFKLYIKKLQLYIQKAANLQCYRRKLQPSTENATTFDEKSFNQC